MQTVAAPASIRDQALAIIDAHLLGPTQPERTLGEVGTTMCLILVALEDRFGIGIDADEVWDHMTARDLLDIVETKLDLQARLPEIGDRIMATVHSLNAERARRARGQFHVVAAAVPPPSGEGDREAVEGVLPDLSPARTSARHHAAARDRHPAVQAAIARAEREAHEPRASTPEERGADLRHVFAGLIFWAAILGSLAAVAAFVLGG